MEPYDSDGVSEVMRGIHELAGDGGPRPVSARGLSSSEEAYARWLEDKTPENMSKVVESFYPTINSEITRYSGSKTLLRSRAKALTVRAIKSFNPKSGARLQSWVVTNLKPLSRYSVKQRDVRIPEVAARQAAIVNRTVQDLSDEYGRDPTDEEIADELGMTVKRVRDVRRKAVASIPSSMFDEMSDGSDMSVPGVVTPSRLPFAQEAVYESLDDTDRAIFDGITGSHGVRAMAAKDVAARLGVSPAAVSQHANRIGSMIAELVNNG